MTAQFDWRRNGRAYVFGDGIGVDGDLMPHHFALTREMDPEVLRRHIFASVDPVLAKAIAPGDVVVAGRRFAQGNPHIQGLIGLAGAGVGLIARSIPSASFRNAVNAGLRFMLDPDGRLVGVATGDLIEADFQTGHVHVAARGIDVRLAPPSDFLRTIIANGGWRPHFRKRLAFELNGEPDV